MSFVYGLGKVLEDMENSAYEKGKAARDKGVALSEHPYREDNPVMISCWLSGWKDREKSILSDTLAAQQSVQRTLFPACANCEYNPCDLESNWDYCPAPERR